MAYLNYLPDASEICGLLFSLENLNDLREPIDALDKWIRDRLSEVGCEGEEGIRIKVLLPEEDDEML